MQISNLYEKQRELDHYIESKHKLGNENLLQRKLLALQVEVGELANETRCFKFWSEKGPSAQDIILEEYVDGVHFVLSIGLEMSLETEVVQWSTTQQVIGEELVPYFLNVMNRVSALSQVGSKENYVSLFQDYFVLGSALGFSEVDIISAYEKKNEVNHVRQDQGY
ncbi:dUTP diphosphatase [Evansella sp. AB-rgal1]|uniref:dUTP diphosphatase n=1 Tax=Evansella sp. AB-rgal1 TaxID=3242696 RepID=UPI00359CD1DC